VHSPFAIVAFLIGVAGMGLLVIWAYIPHKRELGVRKTQNTPGVARPEAPPKKTWQRHQHDNSGSKDLRYVAAALDRMGQHVTNHGMEKQRFSRGRATTRSAN
jgi:hypothetical protein